MDPEEVRKVFFSMYEADYWLMKASTLNWMVVDAEARAVARGRTDLGTFDEERLIRHWKFETHITAYHSTEALLALLRSFTVGGLDAWAHMANYGPRDLEDFASQIADKGIDALRSAKHPDPIQSWFYPGVKLDSEEAKPLIAPMVTFIPEYLQRLAAYYKDDAEYNAYKHGNKATPGRIAPVIKREDGQEFKFDPIDVVLFMDTEPAQHPQPPRYTFRHVAIRYERAQRIIIANTVLIKTLLTSFRAFVEKSETAHYLSLTDTKVENYFEPPEEPKGNQMRAMSFGMRIPDKKGRDDKS